MFTGIILFTFICYFLINITIACEIFNYGNYKWSARVVLLSWTGPIIPVIGLIMVLWHIIPDLFREAFPSNKKI